LLKEATLAYLPDPNLDKYLDLPPGEYICEMQDVYVPCVGQSTWAVVVDEKYGANINYLRALEAMNHLKLEPLPETIRLFSNGSEYESWISRSCHSCNKYRPNAVEREEFVCDIDYAILEAACNDGTVTRDIALRIGMDEEQSYGWQWKQRCPEFVQAENWYSVIQLIEGKQLGFGPFDTEHEALASVPNLRKLLTFLKVDSKSFDPNVDPETVEIIIELLPTRDFSRLNSIYEIVTEDGRLK
jgi:hypothetical protein